LWGLALGSDLLAQSLHWIFLPISMGLLWTFYYRFLARPDQPRNAASLLAPAILATTPCVAIVASWPFNDLAVLAFFLALIYAVTGYLVEGRRGWLWLAGIVGGFALGTKYTQVLFVFIAGLIVFLATLLKKENSLSQRFSSGLRDALLLGLIAVVIGCPWYVKNLIHTGNPVYPLAYNVLGGNDWSNENAQFYADKAAEKGIHTDPETGRLRAGKATSLPDRLALAWRFTFEWPLFEGHIPGFVYVFLLPLIAAYSLCLIGRGVRDRLQRGTISPRNAALLVILIFAWAYAIFWALSYQSNRFLMPSFALLGLLSAAMCADIRGRWPFAAQTLVVLILVACLYGATWIGRWLIFESPQSPLSPALGFVQRDIYLGRALNYYPAAVWLNETAHGSETVLMVGEHRGYYFDVPYLLSDWYDTPRILALLRETPDNDALFKRLYNEEGVRYVFFNGAELSLYFDDYFQPRFSAEEFRRFKEFIADRRLEQVRTFGDPRIYVARLLPPGT
ncbi:MAG: glycosyltransferase family 39 protein, partial [bacterium]